MAVYFDHRIDAPEGSEVPSQLTWHSSLSVLAVASSSSTNGGNVDIYLQQVNTLHMITDTDYHFDYHLI